MKRVVSATEARIRFGELIRRVVEEGEPVLVERGGKPCVVLLSVEEYEHLKAAQSKETWRDTVEEILRLESRIKSSRNGKPLPPPEEIIRELREERDAQLSGLR